ncbi:MAG: PLP-dependent aminotransferase family protein, partial [Candidatus Rokubacteria bacterium]|nr:PLP-dependent aminotransferase family protein [Candidatus Rokubacteria bacterium]
MLPATRELARDLGVNRATVTQAYEELVAAGWARARVGQGTFVAERPGVTATGESGRSGAPGTSLRPPSVEAGPADPATTDPETGAPASINWPGLFSRSAQIVGADDERARALVGAAATNPSVVSFAGGMPDSGLFPTDAFRRVLNHVIREDGAALLQYYPAGGYPPLREYLSAYLLRFGVEARPDEILIVNGSQQGFDLIARTLVDPGNSVAIEQPTYPRAMQVFRSFGAQLLAVPWDAAGPRADVLERLLERHAPKLFYCQPSAHNPTGLTLSAETRRRLLELAARHQVPIVEDGFDGSLYYGARPAVP